MIDEIVSFVRIHFPLGMVKQINWIRIAAFVLFYRVRRMALLEKLPLELKLKIGYMLDLWEAIHGYTSIVWILRKCLDYAKFARKYYEKEREKFDQMEAKTEEIDYRL